MIILDTDVCIELLRGNKKVIDRRAQENDSVAISFMTTAELFYGAEKSGSVSKNLSLVEEFLLTIEVIHSDIEIMKKFAQLKTDLQTNGQVITDADLFIASTTLVKANKLITGNTDHFQRVVELKIENWIR